MTRHGFSIPALAALALTCVALGNAAADDKSAPEPGKAKPSFGGKLVRVDKDKQTIMVRDLVGRNGKETDPGAAKGTELQGMMLTFRVADKARISLDGKDASFADLEAGLFVRVHLGREGIAPKAETGKRPGKGDDVRITKRVEAFTKSPASSPKSKAGDGR